MKSDLPIFGALMKVRSSWTGFLLPMAPIVITYLLVSRFPRNQAAIASGGGA